MCYLMFICVYVTNCLQAGISWTKLPSDVSAYNISLHSSAVTAASKFIFGISAENQLRLRTGIIWNSHVYSFYSGVSVCLSVHPFVFILFDGLIKVDSVMIMGRTVERKVPGSTPSWDTVR